jgi:hypothetical protein
MYNKHLELDDRVMLLATTRWDTDDHNNPLGVVGTVTGVDSGWVSVSWDSKNNNSYRVRDDDLIKLAKNRSHERLHNGDRVMIVATPGSQRQLGVVGAVANINKRSVAIRWDNYVDSYYVNYSKLVVVDDE